MKEAQKHFELRERLAVIDELLDILSRLRQATVAERDGSPVAVSDEDLRRTAQRLRDFGGRLRC